MSQPDKQNAFAMPLAGYLAVWVLLVDFGAIPFPAPLFFSSIIFFVFPATLIGTVLLRVLWRLTEQKRGTSIVLPPHLWRNVAFSVATVLVALFLLGAESTLRQGVQDAAGQLEMLAEDDVNLDDLKQLETRFALVTDRMLDDFFSGEDLTEIEASRAQNRVQEFARAVSDGSLSTEEVTTLLKVYALPVTKSVATPAAP